MTRETIAHATRADMLLSRSVVNMRCNGLHRPEYLAQCSACAHRHPLDAQAEFRAFASHHFLARVLNVKFSPTLLYSALSLAISLSGGSANAASSASASLSFSVLSSGGFAWLSDADLPTYASSEAVSADLIGYAESAGVYTPSYGPIRSTSDLVVGKAVPASVAVGSGATTVATAQTYSNPTQVFSSLSAFALVPTAGTASANAFSRSYFTLDAGATVTFQAALVLAVNGSNPVAPANYNVSEFYGYASGLLAVDGGDSLGREIGGPTSAGVIGAYNLTDAGPLTLRYTNTGDTAITAYLDSGVSVHSASALAPVPEPGTYAMLLAGLFAMGFVVVRRKSGE